MSLVLYRLALTFQWDARKHTQSLLLLYFSLHCACCYSLQCSKLLVAKSPLATNFSRWRPPTCDLVAKKKKKKKLEQSQIFRKEGGQIGSEHSFFRSSASVWSRMKHGSWNSHLSHTYEVLQCRRQSCVAGAFHMCWRKIENKETKRHHVIIHNSKAE